MNVLVLADTHLKEGSSKRLPVEVYRALDEADLVLHAGDINTAAALAHLEEFAPVRAVLGNNDEPSLASMLPVELRLELDGVTVAMVHNSGPTATRAVRMRRRFPDADLVVFGHSHAPVDMVGVEGQFLLNPGSPTTRRQQPQHSYATLVIADGQVQERSIHRF